MAGAETHECCACGCEGHEEDMYIADDPAATQEEYLCAVCADSLTRCEACGEWTDDSDIVENGDGDMVCPNCLDE